LNVCSQIGCTAGQGKSEISKKLHFLDTYGIWDSSFMQMLLSFFISKQAHHWIKGVVRFTLNCL